MSAPLMAAMAKDTRTDHARQNTRRAFGMSFTPAPLVQDGDEKRQTTGERKRPDGEAGKAEKDKRQDGLCDLVIFEIGTRLEGRGGGVGRALRDPHRECAGAREHCDPFDQADVRARM